MAVESLVANVYSQSSDVWSFGIMLWELFTLDGEPYGQISPLDLLQALNMGSRLEACILATNNINIFLHNCWQSDPYLRPSNMDKDGYNACARLDSGIAEGEGYVERNLNTPRL